MGKISCNWKFKDDLSKTNAAKDAFQLFENMLEKENLITRKGTIVDATFVDVPKQHNTHDENNDIKKAGFLKIGRN